MFSGIVKEIGTVAGLKKTKTGFQLSVTITSLKKIKKGASICVSGVCLTVTQKKQNQVFFDLLQETIKSTTLGFFKIGSKVNIEPSLKLGDPVNGHFVYGHVDDVSTVKKVQEKKACFEIWIALSKNCTKFAIPRGSIAINGVGLTIINLKKNIIKVEATPYTIKNTTLGKIKINQKVNIEMDMMAKYAKAYAK